MEESLEERLFKAMEEDDNWDFLKEFRDNPEKQKELALAMKNLINTKLYENEETFDTFLLYLGLTDFPDFWKNGIDNKILYKVFASSIEIKFLRTETRLGKKVINYFGKDLVETAHKYALDNDEFYQAIKSYMGTTEEHYKKFDEIGDMLREKDRRELWDNMGLFPFLLRKVPKRKSQFINHGKTLEKIEEGTNKDYNLMYYEQCNSKGEIALYNDDVIILTDGFFCPNCGEILEKKELTNLKDSFLYCKKENRILLTKNQYLRVYEDFKM